MTRLTRFEQDGIETVIDTDTGEAFITIRGYAKLSGKPERTVRSRSNGARKDEIIETEFNSSAGIETAKLIPASICFEWLLRDNPNLAKEMGTAGAIVQIHTASRFKAHRLAWN